MPPEPKEPSEQQHGSSKTNGAVASAHDARGSDDHGFGEFLAHHHSVTGRRTPGERTTIFKTIKSMYHARLAEDYTLDDLKAATVGAYNDEYRRLHGHYGLESVLRPNKVHDLIEKGRRSPAISSVPSMAQREAAMAKEAENVVEATREDGIIACVDAILFPPKPGEIDEIFTGLPLLQPDQARRRLEGMGLDPDATVREREGQARELRASWKRHG